ncbi:MAG: PQQ-binding-like beta-propeller repeat protein, partial [Planctomycetaceae bacterium]
GNLQWYRGLGFENPNASNSLGMSSSPVVVGNTVVVQVESDAESFACGVDAVTGKEMWRLERPKRANWTSPAVLGNSVVLLQSSKGLAAVDVKTGEEYWNFDDGASTIPSASVDGDLVFIPSNGMTVLKLAEDRKSFEIAWQKSNLRPATPSPLVFDGNVYTVGSIAVSCADAKTGKRKWQLRVKGPFSSTPVAANGHIYAFNEKGVAFVIKPGEPKGAIVSQMDLGQTILSTPAITEDGLFIRSDNSLWKIAKD